MTRVEAIATANAALRMIARGLVRAFVYLGLLLAAALGYIAKLCADGVSAVRTLILQRARGKTPNQSTEYEQQEAVARGKRNTVDRLARPARAEAVRGTGCSGGARCCIRCDAASPIHHADTAGADCRVVACICSPRERGRHAATASAAR